MRRLGAVRRRALTSATLVAFLVVAHGDLALAQFNPRGRERPRPTPTRPATRPATRPTPRPTAPRPTPAAEPSADTLIARYTGILLQQPGAQFPLQRLAELYRKRDGTLDRLVADFEARAARSDAEQWNALVALAGIYRQAGQRDRAVSTYERAIAQRPTEPAALLALGRLQVDRGDKAAARRVIEQALPHLSSDAEREQVLRELMTLSLDLKDPAAAKRFHQQLVKRAHGSFYVRGELGRELFVRGQYQQAVEEYEALVKVASGDNRVLAPALRDLGQAQAKLGQTEAALATLRRALQVAGAQSGVRREVYEIIVQVYRASDRLPELITELEQRHLTDFQELRMLGSVYEETGQVQKALQTYQQALRANGRDLETRIKVVQLLQIQGELDAAIREYEALIRAAPQNPDFVFQLAEALIQRGDREGALRHLRRLEARSSGDEEILAALVDFYERVEEKDRALALLQRLTQRNVNDPRHFVELGERYWQDGKKEQAERTWRRILSVGQDRAAAHLALGEVYLEHNLPQQGLETLREAVKLAPNSVKGRKAYALALERTGASSESQRARAQQYAEALKIWEQLLANAGTDDALARDARQHIVNLWHLSGRLERRRPPLERRLKREPPDLEAGRLLAEVEIRLKNYAAAERTLETVTKHAPGDVSSLIRLERVLVLQRKLRPAIQVLARLVEAHPQRAREYYERMAQYASEIYADDEAVEYAARAVELNPDNPEGHKKLGDMYRQRQQLDKAIQAYRQAISKNDRMFPVYVVLAELLLARGAADEADQLLRRVVRASPDDELVARAARMSMQINLGRGTLESLEKELLPVALGNPQKPLYRQLLVEVYGALAMPLIYESRSSDAAEASNAKQQLERIGERAVKPLLDALNDERSDQQRIAIALLRHIHNRGAGPALFAFATGPADPALRARAMEAVAALEDPALVPKLRDLLVPDGEVRADESDPVLLAAAWAAARIQAPTVRPLLHDLLRSEAPSLRALAALGLGFIDDRPSIPLLGEVARDVGAGPLPRAAAAYSLGKMGAKREQESLTQLCEANDPTLRATAILALARLGAQSSERVIAQALVSAAPEERSAAAQAALVLATGEWHAAPSLDTLESRLSVRALLEQLRPTGDDPDDEVAALVQLAPALARASAAATMSSPERARVVADALRDRGGLVGFAPLTRHLQAATAARQQAAATAHEQIAAAVVEPFEALTTHPEPQVRARAVEFLGTRPEPSARAQVVAALGDSDEQVQGAALTVLARLGDPATIPAIAALLASSHPWQVRRRAAETLSAVLSPDRQNPAAAAALERAALTDPFALVREAATHALGQTSSRRARTVLSRIAREDREPRVRAAARKELGP